MGWNGSASEKTTKVLKSKRSSNTIIIIGAIVAVVAVGVALIWFITSSDKPSVSDRSAHQKGSIREVQPSIARKTPELATVEKPKEIPYWERDTTNGLTRRQLMKWKIHHRPPAGYTNNTSQTEAKPAYAIFEHRSENAISALLTVPPGTTAVGDPEYDQWFTQDFLKSIETPIIVTKNDTPELAQLKREMNAVKIDLKARHDAGEDIAAIMSESRRELQKLANYKSEIEQAFRDLSDTENLTEQDVDDFIAAANKMLDSKGIAPMQIGPLTKRRLLRRSNGFMKENQ